MFEHLIGPLSPRMVPVRDSDYHHKKSRALAEVWCHYIVVCLRATILWILNRRLRFLRMISVVGVLLPLITVLDKRWWE